jgi:hypothetical protein
MIDDNHLDRIFYGSSFTPSVSCTAASPSICIVPTP